MKTEPHTAGAHLTSRPSEVAYRRWPRSALATAGTFALGFGILGLLFVLVGGIGPSDSAVWIALGTLFALAALGRPLRSAMPGHRSSHVERERRGF